MSALMEMIAAESRADAVLALLESAPIAVVVSDEDGIIEMVNARTEATFGYERAELIGQPIEMLMPQRFRRRHVQHRADYFTAPRARPMGANLMLRARRKDGSEFPVEVGLSYVEIDGRRLAVSFVSDITARVEAEEALRQQASELERRVAERTREIERRQRVAEGLRDVLRVLNTARPLDEILDLIVEQASNLLATDAVAIYRQDDEDGQPHIQAARYADMGRLGGASVGDAPSNGREPDGEQAWVSWRQVDALKTGMTQSGRYRSVLAVPLNVKGEIYGSVCLYYRAPRTFSREEKELAIAFADQAALAIENARLREQVRRSAVAEERNRLARELHDAVTQTLFSTSLIAEVLPRLWARKPEEALARLAELRELTRGALAEMRTLLLELRPAALTEAALGDLLQQLAEAITGRARIPVTVTTQGQGALPADVQIAFYRIAQEALNNVAKHAGATQTTINLSQTADLVSLQIQDNGRGFDPAKTPPTSLGLGIMRERAQAIGADLHIESRPGDGTTVVAVWRSRK